MCGILTGIVRKRNKEGKLWAAMRVEDRKGGVEAMAFSTQYDRLLTALVEDQAVLVRGLVLPEENGPPKISDPGPCAAEGGAREPAHSDFHSRGRGRQRQRCWRQRWTRPRR